MHRPTCLSEVLDEMGNGDQMEEKNPPKMLHDFLYTSKIFKSAFWIVNLFIILFAFLFIGSDGATRLDFFMLFVAFGSLSLFLPVCLVIYITACVPFSKIGK